MGQFFLLAWASRQIEVPLIAAGGIGDARTMLAALAAGADGVYMGSAFMATVECPIHDRIKENMVKAQPDHLDLIRELIAPPNPEDFQAIVAARDEMPPGRWRADFTAPTEEAEMRLPNV